MKCDPQDYLFEGSPSLEDTNSSYVENGEDTEMQVYVEPNSAQLNEEHHQMNGQFQHVGYEEPRQSKRRKREDEFANKMVEATKYLGSLSNSFKQSDDEFDVFGKSVAAQLKQFSLRRALSVQSKIQSLLSEERIEEITIKGSKVKVNRSPIKQHRRPSSRNSQLSLQVSCDSETSDLDA